MTGMRTEKQRLCYLINNQLETIELLHRELVKKKPDEFGSDGSLCDPGLQIRYIAAVSNANVMVKIVEDSM